jgi:hypothetical protein
MIPELRQEFNSSFTEAKYEKFLRDLDAGCGTHVTFRSCETPCFFPRPLLEKLAQYGREMILQLVGNSAYLAAAYETIPPEFNVAGDDSKPLFIQVDFGLDHQGEPKLVEIEGFPSLYAYQPYLTETYRSAYGIDPSLGTLLGGLDDIGYRDLLKRAIVGEHEPENVVLLEIDPYEQKTLCDFLLTERMLGVPIINLRDVVQNGRRLFYTKDGKQIPIERIYNRVIVDELQRKSITPPFDLRDELEVEWAGHPNWYYKISKFALPYLDHVAAPSCKFLSEIEALPDNLDDYVLKPLFSFAGLGVRVSPTLEEVMQVRDRADYILQERIDFAPTIETPYGPTKAEIRIMFIWLDELTPCTVLVRMGRGKMMGVDHNRDLRWVGASAAFIE